MHKKINDRERYLYEFFVLRLLLLSTEAATVPFDNTLTSEDIMAASLNIFRGRGILKKQKFVDKLREIWLRPSIVFLIVVSTTII